MSYVNTFIVGGLICTFGQIIINKTKLTPGHVLVLFVTIGVFLSAVGIYAPIVKFGGSGATVPITGFGHALAQGAIKGVEKDGILGAFTGGVSATAGGISAAIFFGYLMAVFFSPKTKP